MNAHSKSAAPVILGTLSLFALVGCADTYPRPHASDQNLLTESEIIAKLDELSGVDSAETSIKPTGFTRFALVTIYIETDNIQVISTIQDYSAKLLYLNSTLPTPPLLIQKFRWARSFGQGGSNQAPRVQITEAVKAKAGVSVTDNRPGTAVRLEIESSRFDGGLRATQIDVDDVPPILKLPPPPVTSSPTPQP
jgi:hypothetical protein